MKNSILDHVVDFDPNIPKGRSNRAARKWLWLFVYDFIFSKTNQKDASGNQLRKVDNDSWTGRKFKKIHEKNVDALLKQNAGFSHDKPLPIPSIAPEHFTKEFFQYWKKNVNMPLIVKGYLKGSEILEESTKEVFIKNGDREIKCLPKIPSDSTFVGQNIPLVSTTLKEFLSSPDYAGYYINNFYGILNDEDFLSKCRGKEINEIQGKDNSLTQWFISRSNSTGTTLHCAAGDNMFLNIQGQKEWYFMDRTYTPVLQPALSKYAIYSISELSEEMHGDFYEDVMTKYPYLKHVPIHKCVLDPGDMLFNPPFWWHRVKNVTDYTVGCATRYWATKEAANSLAFTLSILFDAFRHPLKSSLPTTIRMSWNRKAKRKYIESIFSRKGS